ncbi:MAG: rhodanese-like domain-containing protein [Hahellaceae bacterium]|jgi:rhodanese-related sulfurtransferase|nr:rhodanese-like domain-containing protein [Hahellaceae bacterium]
MDRFLEFIVRHWELSSVFGGLLVALILVEKQRGGKSFSPQQTVLMLNRDEAVVLDVRDKKDLAEGSIAGAIQIPFSSVKERISELEKHKSKAVIVVDKMGQHAGTIVKQLKAAGFENVHRMAGGITEWKASNLPLRKK